LLERQAISTRSQIPDLSSGNAASSSSVRKKERFPSPLPLIDYFQAFASKVAGASGLSFVAVSAATRAAPFRAVVTSNCVKQSLAFTSASFAQASTRLPNTP